MQNNTNSYLIIEKYKCLNKENVQSLTHSINQYRKKEQIEYTLKTQEIREEKLIQNQ
jgi:hypothetical protein